jgi:hypothetical protein
MSYPEVGKKVLIYCKPIDFCCGYYWGKKGTPLWEKKCPSEPCNGWSIMDVTHWQHLPEKPE